MKILLILFLGFLLSSFAETKVSFNAVDIKKCQENLDAVYQYIEKSNLPHQDVLAIEKTLRETFDLLGKGKIDSTKLK